LCGRRSGGEVAGRAIERLAAQLIRGHSCPAGKDILEEWYGLER
jgi:hypothetical protein